jgi:ATP-dependent DNA helicase RecG
MNEVRSIINPILTLSFMLEERENKWFDRKSARIRVADIAPLISAFANADGGTIVIGIDEKSREIEGINSFSDKINDFVSAPKDCCKPMPSFREEFIPVQNRKGEDDRLLLLHVDSYPDQVVRTSNDSTFLRIGDKTKELKGEDLRNLEYSWRIRCKVTHLVRT